ncbi:hypothetical protein ScPMuIL_004280 [Solemya velum]
MIPIERVTYAHKYRRITNDEERKRELIAVASRLYRRANTSTTIVSQYSQNVFLAGSSLHAERQSSTANDVSIARNWCYNLIPFREERFCLREGRKKSYLKLNINKEIFEANIVIVER